MNAEQAITPFQIIFASLIVLFILVVGVYIMLQSRKRAKNDQVLSATLGFQPLSKLPPDVLMRVKGAYQTSTRVKVSNAAQFKSGNEEMYLFDISYQNMRAENGEVEYRTICMLVPNINLPFFLMLYKFENVYGQAGGLINKMFRMAIRFLDMKKIDFSLHPLFDKKYQLYGFKEENIRAVFTPRLLMDLSGTDQWIIRAEGDCVCFNTYDMRRGKMITQLELTQHIQQARKLAGWLSEN
ncbi:MAG: hypothetical protein JEZ00_10820 [Anaerolineaceae bacterium]|nr:hypothetical protein [Anaerolineaceae bacterium]